MDLEARLHSEHPDELRLWLRMLTCTQLIEQRVRLRLRQAFGTSLARFDLMAQLERAPQGLSMSELSRRMMVTGGNTTRLTDELENDGCVERLPVEGDRRAFSIRLTKKGRREFTAMAAQHEAWIVDAFAGLTAAQLRTLHALLGEIKRHQHEIEMEQA
jgi:DNA-binding MarR family transcriptional regulator